LDGTARFCFGWMPFLDIKDPNKPERVIYDRRVPLLNFSVSS